MKDGKVKVESGNCCSAHWRFTNDWAGSRISLGKHRALELTHSLQTCLLPQAGCSSNCSDSCFPVMAWIFLATGSSVPARQSMAESMTVANRIFGGEQKLPPWAQLPALQLWALMRLLVPK
jgi:hypothetical protein